MHIFSNQIYRVTSALGTQAHFEFCQGRLGRLHVPAAFYVMGNVNHLLLVLNSSVNCVIYYCCGETFRKGFARLFSR